MQCKQFYFFCSESGLGSQDILTEKPWKLKKNAGIIFTSGEKGNIYFFVLIIRFRQFEVEKTFFKILLKVVQNHLKREKKSFFPFTPRIRKRNADPKPC